LGFVSFFSFFSGSPMAGLPPVPAGYDAVVEGQAAVLFPSATPRDVFYNKAQVVNRDLSILALRAFGDLLDHQPGVKVAGRDLVILEALAASGLRSLRFWKEVPKVKKVIANDYSADAFTAIKRNAEYNGVPLVALDDDKSGVVPSQADAVVFMLQYRGSTPGRRPNVIDLDPYGTAVQFLDAAVQAVEDGGLLLVTCTDAAVLCGTYPETCFAKYGAITCKAKYCHEMAVRIVLGHIEKLCTKYGRYIVPLVSLSIDFYVRVIVRVFSSKNETKHSLARLHHLYQCCECCAFHMLPVGKVSAGRKAKHATGVPKTQAPAAAPAEAPPTEVPVTEAPVESQEPSSEDSSAPTLDAVCTAAGPLHSESSGQRFGTGTLTCPAACEVCGGRFWVAGPLYGAPIHCVPFVRHMLAILESNPAAFGAADRVRGLLTLAAAELPTSPLFYHLPTLSANLKTRTPPIAHFRAALKQLGYLVSPSHSDPYGIKTNASNAVIYDIMRCWHQQEKKEGAPSGSSPLATAILQTEPTLQVEFAYRVDCDYSAKTTGVLKYPLNEPFWGPMARAKHSPAAVTPAEDGPASPGDDPEPKRPRLDDAPPPTSDSEMAPEPNASGS